MNIYLTSVMVELVSSPMHDAIPPNGWRGSPELWIDAAQAALLECGVEGVKIQPLAKALDQASRVDPRLAGAVPSTKGTLTT